MIYKAENISDAKFTDALYKQAYKEMSAQRKEKANRYKSESDKKLCVFSDMLLREILNIGFGIKNPEIYLGKNGKPCLVGDDLHFSIAHSGNFIACVVDASPVGIDIETPRTINKNTINHCCTAEEIKYISSDFSALPDSIVAHSTEAKRFLTLWTIKEAYLKNTGEGLGGGLKNIITVENGKIRTYINDKILFTDMQKDYVLSVIYKNN